LWKQLFQECLNTKKPLIFSSGMATLQEVDDVMAEIPDNLREQITLLHCSSAYPTNPESCNLSVIEMFKKRYACKVGWSDHTCSKAVVLSSILAWHAECIELHIDIDGRGAEANAGHCWLPAELKDLFSIYRESLKAAGKPTKKPNLEESPDRDWRADPSDGLRPLKAIRGHVSELIKSNN
jgi:N-acetylneuraminate synthase